ncbi:hypothetical protein [Sphaerisporangium rufum]|uniref:hypothetical protein n=1 Tax=Sphaerisporangium rufum TaxID=1381558 RepID=UPI0019524858|nr:hypothetical protein [Sphaerisporangium rufum]
MASGEAVTSGDGLPAGAGRTAGAGDGGEGMVAAALTGLDGLAVLPVSEHVTVFEQVLSGLEAALASAGEAPTGPGDGRP